MNRLTDRYVSDRPPPHLGRVESEQCERLRDISSIMVEGKAPRKRRRDRIDSE